MNENGSSVVWMKGVEQESHGVEKRERWWRSNCVMRRHENPFLAGDLVLVLVLEPPTHTSFSTPHKIHYPTPICNLESMDKTAVAHPSSSAFSDHVGQPVRAHTPNPGVSPHVTCRRHLSSYLFWCFELACSPTHVHRR